MQHDDADRTTRDDDPRPGLGASGSGSRDRDLRQDLGERLARLEVEHEGCARDLADLRSSWRGHLAWDEAEHHSLARELRDELARVREGLDLVKTSMFPVAWRGVIPAAIGGLIVATASYMLGRMLD